MAKKTNYWLIANGMRGCYMYDSFHFVRATTRRELKEALRYQDPSENAPSERAVASLAAAAWRMWRNKPCEAYPMAAPYKREKHYGLFVAPASRAEFLSQQEEC